MSTPSSSVPYRETIATYPNAQQCVMAIETLHESFRLEHKQRRLDVDLWLSVLIHPEEPKEELTDGAEVFILRRAPKKKRTPSTKDTFNLVVQCDDPETTTKHKYQLDWLRAAVEAIPVSSV